MFFATRSADVDVSFTDASVWSDESTSVLRSWSKTRSSLSLVLSFLGTLTL